MKFLTAKQTLLGLLLATTAGSSAASRFEDYTSKFAKTPDQAQVLASSYLGSPGTEWLTAGGFQPDGTVVLAGVALGPDLNLGVKTVVLGRDQPIQPPVRQVKKNSKGQPELDKSGQPKYETLGWTHENATAFIVRLSEDLKQIKTATRLGWKCGGLTGAAVDREGNIYICGPATEGITSLGGDVQALPVPDNGMTKGAASHTYLAKLSPDATRILWVRHFQGFSGAPDIDVDDKGQIKFQGPDLRTFDGSGRQLSQVTVPGGLGGRVAVNPKDGTYARGGEHHWSTGREPWRCPTLNIYKPDGTLLYELYNWGGPFVGLNNLRLVSDSAIRGVRYDDEGNLIIHAWSDGGNSVMYREPNDIRTASKKMNGLGFSAWGAGVLSCAYLIKIDTQNYRVAGGTLWVAYLRDKNKPNSITINSLGFAKDGSICIGGGSAWGLIQTGNALATEPGGNYVAILNPDCTSLRFSSAMPATGQTEINDGARWGIISGKLRNKTVALFLSGAVEKENTYGGELGAPLAGSRQSAFAGGLTDGHVVMLSLGEN